MVVRFEPGVEAIYFGLPAEDYHAAPGLSHSGMKDLWISPKHYWARHVRPDRTFKKSKPDQRFGTALHARLLEPAEFGRRFARERKLDPDAFAGRDVLAGNADFQAWLRKEGLSAKGKQADLLLRIEAAICDWPAEAKPILWPRVKEQFKAEMAGKEVLPAAEFDGVQAAAAAVTAEPEARKVLAEGYSEVSIFVRHPELPEVTQKCRIDHLGVTVTADVKSFSNWREAPISDAINADVKRRRYYSQGVYYRDLRERARRLLCEGRLAVFGDVDPGFLEAFARCLDHDFVFVFAEKAEPHTVDLVRLLRPPVRGASLEAYWTVARRRHHEAVCTYAHWTKRRGLAPWCDPAEVRDLENHDLPGLMFETADEDAEEDFLAAEADLAGMQEVGAGEL